MYTGQSGHDIIGSNPVRQGFSTHIIIPDNHGGAVDGGPSIDLHPGKCREQFLCHHKMVSFTLSISVLNPNKFYTI